MLIDLLINLLLVVLIFIKVAIKEDMDHLELKVSKIKLMLSKKFLNKKKSQFLMPITTIKLCSMMVSPTKKRL